MEIPQKVVREMDWLKMILFLHLNVLSLLGIYYLPQTMIKTMIFALVLILFGTLGVTAGAHRLWAHQSYKASLGLRIFLMICQTLVGQGTIYNWVLQHRIHHKYHNTSLDPYDPSRGFWRSQFLHFLQKPHQYEEALEQEIDMSDVKNDDVVMFQKRFFWFLYAIVFLLLPVNAPAEYWGEDVTVSIVVIGIFRYYVTLNVAWLVHSGQNVWGINANERIAAESNLMFFFRKSYWLDYHHSAPWDFQTGEFGDYGKDCTTLFIRICNVLGMATDIKTVDMQSVRDAAYKAATEKIPLKECLAEIEKIAVQEKFYLKPVDVML